MERIADFVELGLVLIFVKHRSSTEELAEMLKSAHLPCSILHGDMDQQTREEVMAGFRRGERKVLIATDVASRGLDIPLIHTVVNFDCAKDAETHTHRVGRTGRAGNRQGTAYTLLTKSDKRFAGELVLSLEYNEMQIPPELENLALQDTRFRSIRAKANNPRVRSTRYSLCSPQSGDIATANAILTSLPHTSNPFTDDSAGTINKFREKLEEHKKEELEVAFRGSFVSAGTMESTTKTPTVEYAEAKKRSRWDS